MAKTFSFWSAKWAVRYLVFGVIYFLLMAGLDYRNAGYPPLGGPKFLNIVKWEGLGAVGIFCCLYLIRILGAYLQYLWDRWSRKRNRYT